MLQFVLFNRVCLIVLFFFSFCLIGFLIKMDRPTLIWDLPNSEKEAIGFFQEKGLLPRIKRCTSGHGMKLYVSDKQTYWVCNVRTCRQKMGVRLGTWSCTE